MGPDSLPFYVYTAGGLAIFYTGNWEEYHCEVMRTSMYGFGVTEMHWIVITLLCVNGATNNGLSKLTLGDVTGLIGVDPKGYGNERLFPGLFACGCIMTALGVSNNLYTVFTSKKHSFYAFFKGEEKIRIIYFKHSWIILRMLICHFYFLSISQNSLFFSPSSLPDTYFY